MTRVLDLGGGTPVAWTRHIAGALEPTQELCQAGASVEKLAAIEAIVCPPPTFGRTLTAVLENQEVAPVSADDDWTPERRPKRRVAPESKPTPGQRPDASDNPGDRRGVRQRPPTAPARPRARKGPSPKPATTAAHGAHLLPERCDRGALARNAGLPTPAPTDSPKRRRQAPMTRGSRQELSLPTTGSIVVPAVERVAKRLGTATPQDVAAAADTIPATGQAVATAALAAIINRGHSTKPHQEMRTPTGRRREPTLGSSVTIDGSGATDPNTWPRPESSQTRMRPGISKAESAGRGPFTSQALTPESNPGTSPIGVPDLSAVGNVSTHQEQPPVPDRERTTAPLRSSAATTPGDQLEAPSASASASGISEPDDLEKQMKQVLDEAARRHGIEV